MKITLRVQNHQPTALRSLEELEKEITKPTIIFLNNKWGVYDKTEFIPFEYPDQHYYLDHQEFLSAKGRLLQPNEKVSIIYENS